MGYRLGVDLGTTFTAAAVDDGSGARMLGLGNRALQIPSVLFLRDDGTFLCGEAAERRGSVDPSRVVREFKRRIGDPVPMLVAGHPFSPETLSAQLLSWVVATATERQGAPPDEVVLTHPANWGAYKRDLIDQVTALADLPQATTCTEPEAAAIQYAVHARLDDGAKVVVYDLGGGTFDACVLQKKDHTFRILGKPDGVEHLGGVDFDEAVFEHVTRGLDVTPSGFDQTSPGAIAALTRLRRDCVEAKEALSNDVDTEIPVSLPGLATTVRLTRADFEALVTPPLRDTLAATKRALRSADTAGSDLAAVVLIGGSSRIPLVSQLLQRELGAPTSMNTHPKHDTAMGAVQFRPWDAQEADELPGQSQTWPSRGVPVARTKATHSATEQDPRPSAAPTGLHSGAPPAAPPQSPQTVEPVVSAGNGPPGQPPGWAAAEATPGPAPMLPGPKSPSRKWLLPVLTAAAVVAVVVGAMLFANANKDNGDEGVAGTTPPGVVTKQPDVGTCRLLGEEDMAEQFNDSKPVDCQDFHTAETFHVGQLGDLELSYDEYNAEDNTTSELAASGATEAMKKSCQKPFENFVGGTEDIRARSIVSWAWFMPEEEAWDQGARWLRCDVIAQTTSEIAPLPITGRDLLDGSPSDDWLLCLDDDYANVACSDPHKIRATSTIVLGQAGDPWPSEDEQNRVLKKRCTEPDFDAPLKFAIPIRKSRWDAGDRRALCFTETSL